VGADGNYRINDWSQVTGDFWVNMIQSRGMSENTIPTYDFYLTVWPSDFVRMDLDTKRETFDNTTSLRSGITATSINGSIDYLPIDDLRLSLRGGNGFYSDDNERQSGEAQAMLRVGTEPQIEVGVLATGFNYSKLLNNGYFNPKSYWSAEGMFRLQSALSDTLDAEVVASAGVEHATPGGSKPLVKGSLQLTYKVTKDWLLDGGIAYFSSRESDTSGFARTSVSLGLHYKFN
jgi:hypothetical protein